MNEKYEVNMEALYPQLRKALGDDFDVQHEYFELLPKIGDKTANAQLGVISKALPTIDMRDQLLLLRLIHTQHQLAEILCKKYSLIVEEAEDDRREST